MRPARRGPFGSHIAQNIWIGPFPERSVPGFAVIVLCAEELQPKSAHYPGTLIVRCPLDDTLAPLPHDDVMGIMATASYIAELQKRAPVLVTCALGINRSALVTAVALRRILRTSSRAAIALIRDRRPGTLRNTAFVAWLEGLDGVERARRSA